MRKQKKEQPKRAIPYLAILAGIILLAGILRFYNLGFNSLWLDEAASFSIVNTSSFTTMLSGAAADRHPPLHFIALWLIHFVGTSEFWLRVPSAIAGILTVVGTYFLGKEIVNERIGLFAALLLAVSPYHIYYSQEARMYAFAVLFITLAYYLFFKAVHSEDGRYWILMWLCCVAAFYSHFYTGFAIVPLVIGYYFVAKKPSCWFVGGAGLALLLVLPVLTTFLSQSGHFLSKPITWGLSWIMIPVATLTEFSFQNTAVAAIFLLLAGLGLWLITKKDKNTGIVIGLLLGIPILISMLMSATIPFNVRYHIYLLPLFLVVVSVGIDRLTRLWNNRNGTYAAVFLIFLCAIVFLSPYYSTYTKEDWRGFSDTLRHDAYIGDTVVVVPGYMQLPLDYYYSNSSDVTVEVGANTVAELRNITSDRRILYVVTNDIYAMNPNGDEMQWLRENANLKGQYTGIYLFVREAPK